MEALLLRLPPANAAELRRLAKITRIRQADLLREAVELLLAHWGAGDKAP